MITPTKTLRQRARRSRRTLRPSACAHGRHLRDRWPPPTERRENAYTPWRKRGLVDRAPSLTVPIVVTCHLLSPTSGERPLRLSGRHHAPQLGGYAHAPGRSSRWSGLTLAPCWGTHGYRRGTRIVNAVATPMAIAKPTTKNVQVLGLSVPRPTITKRIGRSRKCVKVGTPSARAFSSSAVKPSPARASRVSRRRRMK